MSWRNTVLLMLEEENPELFDELMEDGCLNEWVTETARQAADTYRHLTKDADPMRRAEAYEIVIAQVREEVEPPPEPEPDPDLDEMLWVLRSVHTPESIEGSPGEPATGPRREVVHRGTTGVADRRKPVRIEDAPLELLGAGIVDMWQNGTDDTDLLI